MIARIVRFALTQRGFVTLATAAVIGLGWIAFRQTPIDAFPDVSTPQVKVIMRAPGMTPEEVETRITALIEVEMLGIPKQRILRSVTKYALADITIDFEDGTDVYWARQQVNERLAGLRDAWPAGTEGGVAPLTTPLGEMFMFTIEGGGLDLSERRALLDWVIRPALRTVAGVADVNSLGGRVATFEVAPQSERMLAHGLSVHNLRVALENNNRNDGSGRLVAGEEVLLVRSEGSIRTLADIRGIVVGGSAAEPVRIADVADVQMGSLTRYGAVTRNGAGETVQGLVLGLRGANARDVVAAVRSRLAEIEATLPPGVSIDVFYDRGALVSRAVTTVGGAVGAAIVLVVLVLLVFLADLRAAATTALILPVSVLATFIWMRVFDLSANLMSLGGLAIAIGMLVDSAVVIVENTARQMSTTIASRLPRRHIIFRATHEVGGAVTAGTAIIVLVFLPLLTLEGFEGKLFVPVALCIVFALVSALILSLTMLPVAASFFLRAGGRSGPKFMDHLERWYRQTLGLVFAHQPAVLAAIVVMLALGFAGYGFVGKTFLPALDEGTMIIQLEKLPSISLGTSVDLDVRVQRALMERVPEVTGVIARTGADEIGLDPMGLNQTDAFLVLQPQADSAAIESLRDRMRAVLEDFPGIAYGFTQPIEMRVAEMLTGVRGDVAVKVFGHDLHQLNETATRVADILRTMPGAEDVLRTQTEGAEYLQVDIDHLAAGRLGIDVVAVQEHLRAMAEGVRVGTVFAGNRRIPLVIRGERSLRHSPADFTHQHLTLADGTSVPLRQVAAIHPSEGPVQINRESAARLAVVTANVHGRDLVGFVAEAQRRMHDELSLAPGLRLEWGGEFENQQRAARRLGIVVPVALALIFLILFSTFRSLALALLVLAMIPLALVGGVFSLWLAGEYLSVPATIGFIALLGIAVLNGVVLVSTFNHMRAEGMHIEAVVRDGAVRRLRPVLMTATSTALGLLPLLLASGPGSELQRPLAAVVIGGLITSTALTLLLLPMTYRWLAVRGLGAEEVDG